MEEVKRLASLKDEKINEAKKIAAYEITKNVNNDKTFSTYKHPIFLLF